MKKILLISSGLGLLLLLFVFIKPSTCGADCPPKPNPINLDAPSFNKQLAGGNIALIDLRTPAEYSQGHIANALNIDFNNQAEFNQFLSTGNKNTPYFIYCRSGNRSSQAMQIMSSQGFSNITNLSGGILSWQSSQLPLSQ